MSSETPGRTLLLLIAGPAGSGKTTLCDRLLEEFGSSGLQRVITATSRPPRPGEVDGRDYYFIPAETFAEKIAAGELYEHAHVHGRHYGVLRCEIDDKLAAGTDLLLNIDVQGAATFRRCAAEDPELGKRLVSVFVSVSPETLRERLKARGETDPEEVARRLKSADMERAHQSHFNHTFASASREEDYQRFREIYLSEKARLV